MLEAPLLGELSPKDVKFSQWRRETDLFTGFLATAIDEKEFYPWRDRFKLWHQNAQRCGTLLGFRKTKDNELKLNSANFCKHRLCPMCAKRRSHIWGAKISEILPKIPEIKLQNCIFLTLTVRNFPISQLANQKIWLSNSIKRLIQSLRDRGTILGYIKGFEITRPQNSFNECHPHYHIMIAMTSEYFDRFYIEQQEWRSRWQRAARLDYDPWVRVRKVSNIKSGILETIKYELKPENYVSSWLWTARLAIANKGTQRVSYGGIFREHLRFLKYDPQDLIHECDNELNYSPGGEGKRYMFKWDAKLKHHIYHRTEEISIL